MAAEYMHAGIPVLNKKEGMTCSEGTRLWVSNVDDYDFKIEYLKFEEGTSFLEILSKQPHVAYRVDDLDHYAFQAQRITFGSADCGPGVRLVFVVWDDTTVEFYKEEQGEYRMLVNVDHVLRCAEEKQCCIGAFNTLNLEILMAVIRATEKREEPVIIQHTQLHECEMSIRTIGPIMVHMAKEVRASICVMLDHGENLDYVRKVLDLGSPVVMCDGSSLAYEENVAMTREVVAMVKAYNADVEAEIGIVTGHEGKTFAIDDVSDVYADPELTVRYVKDMGTDALATSMGTVHGFYATKPKPDFDRIVKVKESTGLPLVMYGGSGISVADTQRAIRCGIRKINYSSYMSNAGVKAVKKLLEEKEVKYFHDLANAAVGATKQDTLNAMSAFTLE